MEFQSKGYPEDFFPIIDRFFKEYAVAKSDECTVLAGKLVVSGSPVDALVVLDSDSYRAAVDGRDE